MGPPGQPLPGGHLVNVRRRLAGQLRRMERRGIDYVSQRVSGERGRRDLGGRVVRTSSGAWSATVTDETTGQSADASEAVAHVGASAEWVTEDPAGRTPLADFGSVSFTGLSVSPSGRPPFGDQVEMLRANGSIAAMPEDYPMRGRRRLHSRGTQARCTGSTGGLNCGTGSVIDSSHAVDAGDLGSAPDAQPRSRDPVTELDHGLVHAGGFWVGISQFHAPLGCPEVTSGRERSGLNLVVRRVSGTGAVCP